jgi:SAM-dependent methyltransferase
LAYKFLRWRYPGGKGVPMSQNDPFEARGISKLKTYFGDDIFEQLRNKTVMDFGCGEGRNAIELAMNGCRKVIGIDIQEAYLASATTKADALGLKDKVCFVKEYPEKVDVIVTTDSMEHFADPLRILEVMRGHLHPNGYVMVQFGPTWYHPYGGHGFSVFPWAHLLFTEQSLIRWRSDFKTDGAKRFGEVAGGLNQLSIAKWESLVKRCPFQMCEYNLVPIRAARRAHCTLTRELLTSVVVAKLICRASVN